MPNLILINYLIQLVIIVILPARIQAFPTGAPADACSNLLPRHIGTSPMKEDSPYVLRPLSDSYGFHSSPGNGIKVRIEGPPFKGFLVIAIDSKTGKRVGTWAQLKGTIALDACSGITHSDNKRKKSATLLWLPPKEGSGTVSFVATIVKSYSEYYSPITSGHDDFFK